MKRNICIIMILVIFINALPVYGKEITSAEQNFEAERLIIEELSLYEQNKSAIGLERVDFSKLFIGDAISVYEYLPTGFFKLSEAYLLYEQGEIVTLAYRADAEHFQIMTMLAECIKDATIEPNAIIYDREGVYVYDGVTFEKIVENNTMVVNERAVLANSNNGFKEQIMLADEQVRRNLNYSSISKSTRSSSNLMLNLSCVSQYPYDNLCWAATSAMIYNYLYGGSKTAEGYAREYFAYYGRSFADIIQYQSVVVLYLTQFNHMSNYTGYDEVPSENTIYANIQNGKPIYASFVRTSDNQTHACCLYGVNIIAGRIMVMDPLWGTVTAYENSNGSYSMVYPATAETLVFTSAICDYWGY